MLVKVNKSLFFKRQICNKCVHVSNIPLTQCKIICKLYYILWAKKLELPHFISMIAMTTEQGWCSGESTCLPPMWPLFVSWLRRHMWVECVVGSFPCSKRFFSRHSSFPLSLKTNTSKFHFDLECTDTFQ